MPGTADGILASTHNRLATGGAGIGWNRGWLRGGVAFDVHDHVYGVPEGLDDLDEQIELRSGRERMTGLVEMRRPERFAKTLELKVAAARFAQREVEIERASDGGVDEEVPHDFERTTLDATFTASHGALGPFGEGAFGVSVLGTTLSAGGAEEFHPDGRSLSAALFAFQHAPLADRLALQVGLRLERGRIEASENEVFPGFSARRDATTVSGAVGLHARPLDGLEVGAQIARAHRAPLLEQLFSNGPHIGAARFEVGRPDLRTEVGHGFDLFARYSNDRLSGEIALFHNEIDHFVFPRHTGETDERSGLPIVRWSPAEASFVGGEVSLKALLSPSLQLSLTGDHVRSTQRDEARTPLPFIPPTRAGLGLQYDPGGWWLGGRTRVAGRQGRVPPRQKPTDRYTLLDLQAGLRMGPHRDHTVVLRVDNALDTVYRDHLSRVDERRFPMPGRNLSVVYEWTF